MPDTVALQGQFAAEATGRTDTLLAERDGEAIKKALLKWSVIVIRGRELAPTEHVALTRILGDPEVVTDLRNHHPESVDILVVSNSGGTPVVGNKCWHSDRSFLPEPTRCTVLRADVVPRRGGDTLFADMVGAYAESSAEWKDELSGAVGIHTYDKIARMRSEIHRQPVEQGYERKYPPVRHPVVRAHPETGSPALYLNELCLDRMESAQGAPLGISVEELHAHATHERFVYRHQWREGDIVIWDNARVLHRADELAPGVRRVMHRTTTAGGPPLPAMVDQRCTPGASVL